MGRKKARRANAANTAVRILTLQAPPATAPSTDVAVGAQNPIAIEAIEFRAYSKWLARGRPHGDDASDWFAAENELRSELQKPATRLHSVH